MNVSRLSSNVRKTYQQCTRCVMDTTAVEITFDKNGVCNFCTEFLERSSHIIHEDAGAKKARLDVFVSTVKKVGESKAYESPLIS